MFIFAIILLIISIICWISFYISHKNNHDPYHWSKAMPSLLIIAITTSALSTAIIIQSMIITGQARETASKNTNSIFLIEQKNEQRENLLLEVKDNLSNNEYLRLIQAYTPQELEWLNTRPDIAEFLLGKTDRIVSLNKELYRLENTVLQSRIDLCAQDDNFLLPKFPGFPTCELKIKE